MSLPAELDRSVQRSAMSTLAQYPQIAESWIEKLASRPLLQGTLINQIVRRKAEKNPEAAFQWITQYDTSPSYPALRSTVLQAWAQKDPERVALIITDNSEDENYSQLIQTATIQWARVDADAALDWVLSLPQSQNRQNAMNSVISNITELEKAITFLDRLSSQEAENFKMRLAFNLMHRQLDDVEQIIRQLHLPSHQADLLRTQAEKL